MRKVIVQSTGTILSIIIIIFFVTCFNCLHHEPINCHFTFSSRVTYTQYLLRARKDVLTYLVKSPSWIKSGLQRPTLACNNLLRFIVHNFLEFSSVLSLYYTLLHLSYYTLFHGFLQTTLANAAKDLGCMWSYI